MQSSKPVPRFLTGLLLAMAGWGNHLSAADRPRGIPEPYRLLYEQDFEQPGTLEQFVFSDARAWKLATTNGSASLELYGKSQYIPEHRSPFNIALIANLTFGDFVLDVDVQSTVKPYNHQDMCLFFGFEATNRYYYAHIAVKPDPIKAESHAHDIFIVKDAPRLAIAKEVSAGVVWGQSVWHKVRVERKLSDGSIKVYFDDLTQPIMTGTDKTFGAGYIGFGSFDDAGRVDNIRVWGPASETRPIRFFAKP